MAELASAKAVWSRLARWPEGYFIARFEGRRYGVTRSVHAGGRSMKLFGEELGGSDFISLNIYVPADGELVLKPCKLVVSVWILIALDPWRSGWNAHIFLQNAW